jgi:hypothetical protein
MFRAREYIHKVIAAGTAGPPFIDTDDGVFMGPSMKKRGISSKTIDYYKTPGTFLLCLELINYRDN